MWKHSATPTSLRRNPDMVWPPRTSLANLNSHVAVDYRRQDKRLKALIVTWYIVEQLPVIAPADYDRSFQHDDRSRPRPRPRPPPHVHRPRHGPLRPRPRLRRRALHLGTKRNAATSAPASTPSTSTSMACRGTPPNMSSTPSPSFASKTKPPSEHTAPAI